MAAGPGEGRALNLASFVLRRLLGALATLVGVVTLVFFLAAGAPGDAAGAVRESGGRISREALEAYRRLHGLDRPLGARFAAWLASAARLDFGRSFQDGRPVAERVAETLPRTLALNGAALALAFLAAVPIGVLAARRPGRAFDRASGLVLDGLFAAPTFVLGLGLLLVFSVALRWTPLFADPEAGLAGVVLPLLSLALPAGAALAQLTRRLTLTALRAPALLAARARGAGAGGESRRALRLSAAPLVAAAATLLPVVVAGSVPVERLFAYPGFGQLLAEAVHARDYPTVLGVAVVAGLVIVVGSLVADLAAAFLDPRLREREDAARRGTAA